eukprot:g60241.t1
MPDSKKDKVWLVAAGGLALVGVGAVWYLYSRYQGEQEAKRSKIKGKKPRPAKKGASKKASKPSSSDDSTSAPTPGAPLSKEKLLQALRTMLTTAHGILENFPRFEAEYRTRNPEATHEQIIGILGLQYQHSLQSSREKVLRKHQTTEQGIQKALDQYENDEDVMKLVAEFKNIEETLNRMAQEAEDPELAAKIAQLPEDLTLEKVKEIFTTLMQQMIQTMEETVNQVNAMESEGRPMDTPQKNMVFQRLLYNKQADVKSRVLESYQLDEATLDLAIRKYQTSEEFVETFRQQQMEQQRRVSALLESLSSSSS